MTSVWSHRPQLLHLALFVAAYVLGCGFAQSLALVPGTDISIWPPGGLFIATLILTSTRSWPWWVLAGCLAELFGQFLWFHSPLPAAFLIYVGNALEAVAGAWLVNRICGRPVRLETLREVLAVRRAGRWNCAGRQRDGGKCDTCVVWHAIANLHGGLASMVDRRRHRDLDRGATGTGRVPELAPRGRALGRAMDGSLRPGADLSRCRRPFLERLPALRLHHHAASSLGRGALRLQGRRRHLDPSRSDHGGIHDIRRQPICRRSRVPEAKADHAAALSGHLGIFGAHRGRHIPAAPAGGAHVAPKRGGLRDRERELSQLVDMVPSHLWRLTPRRRADLLQQAHGDFLGLDVADTDRPGMSRLAAIMAAIVHPDDAAGVGGSAQSLPRHGRALFHAVSPASRRWRLSLDGRRARSRCAIRADASSSGTASPRHRRSGEGRRGAAAQLAAAAAACRCVPTQIWS